MALDLAGRHGSGDRKCGAPQKADSFGVEPHLFEKLHHSVSRRGAVGAFAALLATGAAAQPYGPGHPPPWMTQHRPGQGPEGIGSELVDHVDVHMHLVGGRQGTFGEAVESCVATMEQFKIPRAVVMGPPQLLPGGNDSPGFLPELRRYGARFAFLGGGGILNPILHAHADPESVTPEVRQDFIDTASKLLDQGASGFGEIAILHLSLLGTHPFEQVSTTHPLMSALASVAARRNVVIDLHMDAVTAMPAMRTPQTLKVPPNSPTLNGNIAGFERLLTETPGARIVWAHGGTDLTGNLTPALIGRLMDAHPNLFMSLRPAMPQVNSANPLGLRFYNLILTQSGIDPNWLVLLRKHHDRFVMGSDSFFVSPSASPEAAPAMLARGNQGRLAAAGAMLSKLPSELQARIALENPARIYRI
jgi:Amidohydrolase